MTAATSVDLHCTVSKPPNRIAVVSPSVFLAGSIETGKAIDWQTAMTNALSSLPVTVLNPRRDDWDSSWIEDISNKQFKEQVDWEMDHLEKADVIALNFEPGTMSPISLLELGLHAASKKIIVCCPQGFWKRGNVQVVCERYDLPLLEDKEEFVGQVKERLTNLCVERSLI